MTTHTPVPADVDAVSMIDLVRDCREISGVLGGAQPRVVHLPGTRGSAYPEPVHIDGATASGLDGYGAYGS